MLKTENYKIVAVPPNNKPLAFLLLVPLIGFTLMSSLLHCANADGEDDND